MDITLITAKDNAILKQIKKLQTSSKQRKEDGLFVLEGTRLLDDACENNIAFKYLITTQEFENKHLEYFKKFALNSEKCVRVPDSLMKSICDTNTPQGVLAVAYMPNINNFVFNNNGKYIALENLQDPSNIGAIARTAEALGINGILFSKECCDVFSPKVLRASMGTVLRIPIFVCDDLIEIIKNSNIKSYACVVHGDALKLGEFSFENKAIAVIGNEGNGLTEEMILNCDERITISMSGKAESLNAAAAAAIVMWEMSCN